MRSTMEAESRQRAMTAATSTFQTGTPPVQAGLVYLLERRQVTIQSWASLSTTDSAEGCSCSCSGQEKWAMETADACFFPVARAWTEYAVQAGPGDSRFGYRQHIIATSCDAVAFHRSRECKSGKGKAVPMLGPTDTLTWQPSELAAAVAPMVCHTL